MRWYNALIVLFAFWSGPGWAAPVTYILDMDQTIVVYQVAFQNGRISGRIPIRSAKIELDFEGLQSSVDVVLDAQGISARPAFTLPTVKSKSLLNAKDYPTIRFVASGFPVGTMQSSLKGHITMRGETRPIVLMGQLFRQRGTASGDRSKMAVHLIGRVNRSEFGADGFSELVGDEVVIRIIARLERAQ